MPWQMDRVALVTGGRDFNNREYVWRVLDFHTPSLIVHGGATGVDTFADQWAYWHGIPRTIFAISNKQWREFGKAEGGNRNGDMVVYLGQIVSRYSLTNEPEWSESGIEGIVFPGGDGTANMMRKLMDAGIPWWDYRDGGEPADGREIVRP
jgi:hypothetical protein